MKKYELMDLTFVLHNPLFRREIAIFQPRPTSNDTNGDLKYVEYDVYDCIAVVLPQGGYQLDNDFSGATNLTTYTVYINNKLIPRPVRVGAYQSPSDIIYTKNLYYTISAVLDYDFHNHAIVNITKVNNQDDAPQYKKGNPIDVLVGYWNKNRTEFITI